MFFFMHEKSLLYDEFFFFNLIELQIFNFMFSNKINKLIKLNTKLKILKFIMHKIKNS